ncbi:MAG: hypothetical protein V4668_03695 [Patescibacteria group bacterium]
MNPNNNEMVSTLPEDSLGKQPHPVNQITRVSKYLALALFVILPFLGGYVGYQLAVKNSIGGNTEIISMSSPEVVNQQNLQGETLYYFSSYDDVVEYISSTNDPHINWKSKAQNKLKVVDNVLFEDQNLSVQNERYSMYFLLSSSTSDGLVFSRGSLIKGGEPIGTFKLNNFDNTLIEISDKNGKGTSTVLTNDDELVFADQEIGISFSYPASWESIAINYEEGYCDESYTKKDCKFYTFAPSNDPVRIFLVAQTQNKPLIGRGAFWGDSMNSSLNKETIEICRVDSLCSVVTNYNNLNFTKQTNVHTCGEGAGCEGEGDYYQHFNQDSSLVKFSFATYRLTDEDKKKFEDIVIDSFNII